MGSAHRQLGDQSGARRASGCGQVGGACPNSPAGFQGYGVSVWKVERVWVWSRESPLALVGGLLGLLQLLQSCCQPLLGPVQLFLHQLDPPVQRSHFCLRLDTAHVHVTATWRQDETEVKADVVSQPDQG